VAVSTVNGILQIESGLPANRMSEARVTMMGGILAWERGCSKVWLLPGILAFKGMKSRVLDEMKFEKGALTGF
jgi:hypothetical protein